MDDNLEVQTARLEYLQQFFQLLFDDGQSQSPRLLMDMPYTLALLVVHNPGTLLSHIPFILTDEAACFKCVANIPSNMPVRNWWGDFWHLRATERLSITLYAQSRI